MLSRRSSIESTSSATRGWLRIVSAPMTAHCSAVDSSIRVKVVAMRAFSRPSARLSYRRPMEQIEALSAVTLATADMAASVRFYEAVGFRAVVGGAEAPFTTFRAGSGFLNLQLDADDAPVGAIWGRAIFWVADVDVCRGRQRGFRPRDGSE